MPTDGVVVDHEDWADRRIGNPQRLEDVSVRRNSRGQGFACPTLHDVGRVSGTAVVELGQMVRFSVCRETALAVGARLAELRSGQITIDASRSIRVIVRSNMVPRTHSEDSDPVLEVAASGTANSNGEYLQHDAVAPHKPRSAAVDPMTVVVRNESVPPVGAVNGARGQTLADDAKGLADVAATPEETTSITKAGLRAKSWSLFRLLAFVETHRITTLMFVVGGLLLLLAALLATR
jgi:hypothetical protein